jgi:hypothetical protein
MKSNFKYVSGVVVLLLGGAGYYLRFRPENESREFPCKDPAKARVNFSEDCNFVVRLEEMNSGVINRYKTDPCLCIVREFPNLYKLSDSADCKISARAIIRDDDVRAFCMQQR